MRLGNPALSLQELRHCFGISCRVGDFGNDLFPILADADDNGIRMGLAHWQSGDRRASGRLLLSLDDSWRAEDERGKHSKHRAGHGEASHENRLSHKRHAFPARRATRTYRYR